MSLSLTPNNSNSDSNQPPLSTVGSISTGNSNSRGKSFSFTTEEQVQSSANNNNNNITIDSSPSPNHSNSSNSTRQHRSSSVPERLITSIKPIHQPAAAAITFNTITPVPLLLDPLLPITELTIILYPRQRIVLELNETITIAALYSHILYLSNHTLTIAAEFDLYSGYPSRPLIQSQLLLTIKELGLCEGSVIQRLKLKQ